MKWMWTTVFALIMLLYRSSGPCSTFIQVECGMPLETNCSCQVAKRSWTGWPLHTAACKLLSRYATHFSVQLNIIFISYVLISCCQKALNVPWTGTTSATSYLSSSSWFLYHDPFTAVKVLPQSPQSCVFSS
jgi:hypothetical protein